MDSRTTFSDSNDNNSGSSSISFVSNTETLSPEISAPDVTALRRLSENLESIFESRDFDFCSDATIVVDAGREVPVHRCILSARSPFFKTVFSRSAGKDGGTKFELKELTKDFEVGFNSFVTVLAYLYGGKIKPSPKDVCVCVDDNCSHIGCRPAVDFMVEVLYASFTFQISELVALYQRHLLGILNKVAADDILVVLSVAYMCDRACQKLMTKCIEIIVKSDTDIVTLEKTLPHDVVKQIVDSRIELGLDGNGGNIFPDKHVKRIHRALDSDDVELVRMLLKEGHTTLDDAYALHYAVGYCDAKTTTDLLDLGLADVNHKNPRGFTVLHVAAMRKEPKIIVSLLTKGARPSDLTPDGRKALQISKRLTKSMDYLKSTEEGKASPKDRLCIEILEQAERRDPLLGEASVSLAKAGDDLRMRLLYLENRVALAKLLFPMEAQVAMDIAHVDGTTEFPLTINSRNSPAGQRAMNLNEAPFKIEEEHLNRLRALSKTVELGKRFFPRCSEVLNNIMDADDLSELAYLGNDTPEERQQKKRRYTELQETLSKAFDEDKEAFNRSTVSSSCSSTSIGMGRSNNRHVTKK
ncbi:PREDICTED: BTB/POZ domain and ankyrin repeat-containing protein NPR1-like [Nelumbo nucifera]|uniref:BTB/POZ domain and ankyrin repeat-containing protein NPR1-like n=1 Tax=Nelumbo nucifera TaxID=4432 RepID=A0A1U8AIS8_NELNU|nr:PREDICTED: BTB/POZ domain and ankyrin repeat-containing protein NPR1-like [Nelumbo nucifera]